MSRMHSGNGPVLLGMLVLFLAVLTVYANGRRHVEVAFSASSDIPARLQIFPGRGNPSEARSQWFALDAGAAPYSLLLSGGGAARLRVDPSPVATTVLCDLRIGQSGATSQFEVLQSEAVEIVHEGRCLRISADAAALDPQLVVRFHGGAAKKVARAARWQNVFLASLPASVIVLLWLGFSTGTRWPSLAARLPVIPGIAWFQMRLPWLGALLMLVLGTAYAIVTPPGAVADEAAHLSKVVRIANGVPFGDSGSVPMPDTRGMYGPFSDYPTNQSAFTAAQLRSQLLMPVACEGTSTTLPRGANGYFPHQYLLPTLAYKAACATGASFGTFLYLARLLNLLLATALVAWGLAYARRGRWGLWLIALLPMSLFQMGSISADSLALSLSLAWLGLMSGIAGGALHPARAAPALWALTLAIALLKPGSAWILAALVFCRPAYAAAGVPFLPVMARFVALPWAVHVLWSLAASGAAPVLAGVDPEVQAASLLQHPTVFFRAWVDTFFSSYGTVLLRMMIGVLGWLDVWLSPRSYALAFIAMVAALWTSDHSAGPAEMQPRFLVLPAALLLALGSMALIALPLFVLWTEAGAPMIRGLQGRYFTATAAFVLTWCSFRTSAPLRSLLIALIVVTVLAINIDALYRLYDAYYVSGRS